MFGDKTIFFSPSPLLRTLDLRPVPNVVLLPCRTQMNLARQWHDDSTAAVSNVEPNAVAPNSKDKTNHPSSGIAPSKMAEGNLNEEREKFVLFKTILNARRQRRRMQQSILNTVIARRGLLLKVFSFILLLVSLDESQQVTVLRSCRRFQRNLGWWNTVWNTYSEKRFKQTLRVSRGTFQFILNQIRHDLERDVVCEDPIPPDMRLAICLYRLGRGDQGWTLALAHSPRRVSKMSGECKSQITRPFGECDFSSPRN